MAKLTLADLANLQNETTAVAAINANSALIEAAVEDTLSRDGTAPNQMEATLDMNSNRIINLPTAISTGEPLTLGTFEAASVLAGNVPTGGTAGQFLVKDTSTDYDTSWQTGILIQPTFDWYVDSLGGSDSNNGSTIYTPFLTLGAAKTAVAGSPTKTTIGLKRNSHWREQIESSTITSIGAYGTGDHAPVIDGTNVITGWIAEGTANVWKATVSGDFSNANSDRMTVYENGVMMTRVADAAACSALAGSYADIHGVNSPVTVKIHTFDTANPNTNGRTYEVSVRSAGITLTASGASVDGIETQRVLGNNGSLVVNTPGSVTSCLATWGTKHNILVGAGTNATFSDIIACNCDLQTAYENTNATIVMFQNDISGVSPTFKRMGVIYDGTHTVLFNTSFFDHSNVGGVPATMTFEQCWTDNSVFGMHPITTDAVFTGLYSSATTTPIGGIYDNATYDCAQIIMNEGQGFDILGSTAGPGTYTFRNCVIYVPVGGTQELLLTGGYNNKTLEFDNCLIYSAAAGRTFMQDGGWAAGNLSVNNCIIVMNAGGGLLCVPAGITYTGNNNVFLNNTSTTLGMFYNGVLESTIADWRTATGQDAASIPLGATDIATLFSGSPAAGNFTLGNSGAGLQATGITAGPQKHWDWNRRAIADGPPTVWPVVPTTFATSKTYINDPTAWVF